MPRGQRNTENAAPKKTRTVRPRMTDAEKAIAEVDKLRPRVKATEEKLKKVRAEAASLDETLKADQKLLTWALQNPFLPEGYGDQADVPAGDAPDLSQIVAGEQYDAEGESVRSDDTTAVMTAVEESHDDLPGADVVAEAAEERVEQQQEGDGADDPFAQFGR